MGQARQPKKQPKMKKRLITGYWGYARPGSDYRTDFFELSNPTLVVMGVDKDQALEIITDVYEYVQKNMTLVQECFDTSTEEIKQQQMPVLIATHWQIINNYIDWFNLQGGAGAALNLNEYINRAGTVALSVSLLTSIGEIKQDNHNGDMYGWDVELV